jgi:hypothetical protein
MGIIDCARNEVRYNWDKSLHPVKAAKQHLVDVANFKLFEDSAVAWCRPGYKVPSDRWDDAHQPRSSPAKKP